MQSNSLQCFNLLCNEVPESLVEKALLAMQPQDAASQNLKQERLRFGQSHDFLKHIDITGLEVLRDTRT